MVFALGLPGAVLLLASIGLRRRGARWLIHGTGIAGGSLVVLSAWAAGMRQFAGRLAVLVLILLVIAGIDWWDRRGKHGAR